MQTQIAVPTWHTGRLDGWRLDLFGSLCTALLLLGFQAVCGFPTLFDSGGDNDAMMRLAQVRDLLGGQGWFDLHQYRMGVEGGFLIHWSRIVDLPVAAIMFLATAAVGNAAMGEMVAEVVWPTLLLIGVLFLLLRISGKIGGPDVFLPTLVISAITLNMIGLFTPRSLDHHNLQLLLALAALLLLMSNGWRAAAGAGLCCALMLGVGMETLPYVAIAGCCTAVAFLINGRDAAEQAIGFGLGFAISALLVMLATVPPQSWWTAQCDAYSAGLAVVAVGAGFGLAIAAGLSKNGSLQSRTVALGVLGVAAVAVATLVVPQCFEAPYASLDPRLKKFWIDAILEAQPLWRMITLRPEATLQSYATPILAAGLLIAGMMGRRIRRENAIVAAFLTGAVLVSIWQVRGANFSIPFAIMPLSAWVANARRQVEEKIPGATTRLVMAYMLSLNLVWGAASHGIGYIVTPDQVSKVQAAKSANNVDVKCYADATYAQLARQPATTVLTISNLGAPLIANTPHRTLAGPAHRNIDGNIVTLEAFMGSDDEARAIAKQQNATLLAFCPENGESLSFADAAPTGFMAHLIAGKIPAWLEPLPETMGEPLKLYRIR